MDVQQALALLGGLSAESFMRRHWQKKPLLVRQAMPGVLPPIGPQALFALAASDDVESRLVLRDGRGWSVRQGPLPRRALPPRKRREWTLLVQGVDLHVDAAHQLLQQFRFVPDARLDDLMVSFATDGGGVGPHLDSYDVFLLQVQGRRRWSVAPVAKPAQAAWVDGAPLKILRDFTPQQQWLLEAGDMLYLPPGWAHDGVAQGECITCSIGFRAPSRPELAAEMLARLAGDGPHDDAVQARLYRDPAQPATANAARVPAALQGFARRAVAAAVRRHDELHRVLGESLTEPKARVWFEAGAALPETAPRPTTTSSAPRGGMSKVAEPHLLMTAAVALHARTKMLYDDRHLFINGESHRIGGRDARLLRQLADERWLAAAQWRALGGDARAVLQDWARAGWLQVEDGDEPARR